MFMFLPVSLWYFWTQQWYFPCIALSLDFAFHCTILAQYWPQILKFLYLLHFFNTEFHLICKFTTLFHPVQLSGIICLYSLLSKTVTIVFDALTLNFRLSTHSAKFTTSCSILANNPESSVLNYVGTLHVFPSRPNSVPILCPLTFTSFTAPSTQVTLP